MGNGFLSIVFSRVDEIKGEITTDNGLEALLDSLFSKLMDDEAVVLMIKNNCTLICTRKKGHGDHVLKKFTNIGFAGSKGGVSLGKAEALSNAIRTIADNLPEYCYDAIKGDEQALRKTTEHLFKVYKKKAERMKAKHKPAKEIAQVLARQDEIGRYLELEDGELSNVIDTLIIEVPKCPEKFEELDELAAIGVEEIDKNE
jgi:hypothetical protein